LIYDATALRGRERLAAYFRARERLGLDEPDVAAEPFHTAIVANAQLTILAGILDPTTFETQTSGCARLFTKAYAQTGNALGQTVRGRSRHREPHTGLIGVEEGPLIPMD